MTDLGDLNFPLARDAFEREARLNAAIRDRVAGIEDDLIRFRRSVHARPELAFQEFNTAAEIARLLSGWGITCRTGVGKTGVVATIEGGKGRGRTVAVRADMDALPIVEAVAVPFASREPGRMHACGHDVHSAVLLGVARVVQSLRAQLRGRVKLIFQPAEETLEGARAMIADGVLEDPAVDVVLGFHNWPALPAGTVGYHDGPVFASSDAFDIVIEGVSGHAGHPHKARDTIVAAAHLIMQVQTLVSRERDPLHSAVISIGQIHGGTVRNILPRDVRLEGTLRAHDAETRNRLRRSLTRMVRGVGETFGVSARLDFLEQSPALRNDPDYQAPVLASARAVVGLDKVVRMPNSSMGSEDFALFAERVPGVYLRLGSGGDGCSMLHSAEFNPDENCIATGVTVFARIVADLLSPP